MLPCLHFNKQKQCQIEHAVILSVDQLNLFSAFSFSTSSFFMSFKAFINLDELLVLTNYVFFFLSFF